MSAELPRWAMGDPARIVERLEEAEQRAGSKREKARIGIEQLFVGDAMTQEESEKIEELLAVWYDYERRYRVALGAPRVSVSCRDHQPDTGDTHDTGADRDDKLEAATARMVEKCVDELELRYRVAIGTHLLNRSARASVYRNSRIENQHETYKQAKELLCSKLKKEGLL